MNIFKNPCKTYIIILPSLFPKWKLVFYHQNSPLSSQLDENLDELREIEGGSEVVEAGQSLRESLRINYDIKMTRSACSRL